MGGEDRVSEDGILLLVFLGIPVLTLCLISVIVVYFRALRGR